MIPTPLSEERTAHHVRRLQASVRDLQNALGVYARAEHAPRPPRASLTVDTPTTDDPRSRITANNDRGVVRQIERLEEIGAVVLGLEGIGTLVADALCRYGVQRLIVGDTATRALGDLDFMACYVQDVGAIRERHVATVARQIDPEIHVFALDVPLTNPSLVVESLRAMLVPPEQPETSRGHTHTSQYDNNEGDSSNDDDDDDDGSDESSNDSDDASSGDDSPHDRRIRNRRPHRKQHVKQHVADHELCFSVVFLCGPYPELAMALNELCCEFGVQLVYVSMGKNGLSGDALSVAPGRSACLQCLEKRKMIKISSGTTPVESGEGGDAPMYSVGLPTTECVLAGIAVQHSFAHLLGAGPICSRVEYDGYREEFDRSGFVAPVHLCPSVHCRQQQQHHQQQRPPPTASSMSS